MKVGQTGVVCCCHIDDYNNNIIKKHEKTRQDKEDDRTRHVLTLNANAGPVFLTFKDQPGIAGAMTRDSGGAPLFDFAAPDGVRHVVWRVDDPRPYVEGFNTLDAAYVADGHHRSASAARAGAERKAANPAHTGEEEYNWFLTVLFPASELTCSPTNRVAKDLNGLSPDELLAKLGAVASVTPEVDPQPALPRIVRSVCRRVQRGRVVRRDLPRAVDRPHRPDRELGLRLAPRTGARPAPRHRDIRTDKRVDFVGGIRGPGELKRLVDSGAAAAGFCMHPVTIAQLMAVSDAGQIMPPKSTWFEPKLRSGLLVHTLDS